MYTPQNHGTSLAMGYTCHGPTQANASRLTPTRNDDIRYDLPTRKGWVDELSNLGGWLHTEMLYPPADGHPSKF